MTDAIDQLLINALMEDSRRSLKALAQISGLSAPSVSERLRRLEERGVLRGYTVDVDPRSFGYQLQAIVRIRPLPGQLQEVERQIICHPPVHRVRQGDRRGLLHCPAARALDGAARHAAGPDQCAGRNQYRDHQEVAGETALAADGVRLAAGDGPAQ